MPQDKVTINTATKTLTDHTGHYPVGHISNLVEHYVRCTEDWEKLTSNMTAKIKELESQMDSMNSKDDTLYVATKMIVLTLKNELLKVQAWWEPSMDEANKKYDNIGSETDMQLRHFPGDKLGGRGL